MGVFPKLAPATNRAEDLRGTDGNSYFLGKANTCSQSIQPAGSEGVSLLKVPYHPSRKTSTNSSEHFQGGNSFVIGISLLSRDSLASVRFWAACTKLANNAVFNAEGLSAQVDLGTSVPVGFGPNNSHPILNTRRLNCAFNANMSNNDAIFSFIGTCHPGCSDCKFKHMLNMGQNQLLLARIRPAVFAPRRALLPSPQLWAGAGLGWGELGASAGPLQPDMPGAKAAFMCCVFRQVYILRPTHKKNKKNPP